MLLKRSGDEPVHARSPLRLRFWLALWGLILMIAVTVFFVAVDHPGWAALTAAIGAITAVDLVLILRHMRQGAHYQPGRDVPPYEPDDGHGHGHGHGQHEGS